MNKIVNKSEFVLYASEVLYNEWGDISDFCWSADHRRWMVWDGKRWTPTTAFEMDIEASETLQRYWTALGDTVAAHESSRSECLQHVEDLLTVAKEKPDYVKAALRRLLRIRDDFRIAKGRWDNERYLLNVRNGTVDMKTRVLYPHNPVNLLTRLAPVEFVRDAEAPKWEAHLEHCLPDVDARLRMRRDLGRALVTGLRPLWYGGGNDGKYLTAMVLRRVLGDHAHPGWFPELVTEREGTNHCWWSPPVRDVAATHWQHSVPRTYRGHTSEVVADLLTESSGILWWLLNGVSSWLHYGFS